MLDTRKWITKRNVLVASLLIFVAFVLSVFVDARCDYGTGGVCAIYWEQIRELTEILIISVPLFVIATITYFIRDEFFNAWIKFVIVWVPLTVFLTLMAPEYSQSILPVEKGGVSFIFSALFFIISTIIILAKRSSLSSSRKK